MIPERLRPRMASRRLVVPEMHHSEEGVRLLGELRGALDARMRVFIAYRDARDNTTERIVRPLALAWWAGNWTLAAWCELRQDFRNFRIDRIAEASVLSSCFEDEPGRTLEDYMAAMSARA